MWGVWGEVWGSAEKMRGMGRGVGRNVGGVEKCGEMCWGVGGGKDRCERRRGRVYGVSVEVQGSVFGCGGGKRKCGEKWGSPLRGGEVWGKCREGVEKCAGRCKKVCWGEGDVERGVGKYMGK